MKIIVHEDCKKRLVEALMEIIYETYVSDGCYVDYKFVQLLEKCDAILPRKGKPFDELKVFLGDAPFASFTEQTISQHLALSNFQYDDGYQALSELGRYKNAKEAATDIVESFCSLPYEYLYSMEMPDNIGDILPSDINLFSCGDSFKISRINNEFNQIYPLSSGNSEIDFIIHRRTIGGLLSTPDPKWNTNSTSLQFLGKGFSGWNEKLNTDIEAESSFRSFLGLSLALGLISYNFKWRPRYFSQYFYIHRKNEGKFAIQKECEADNSLSDIIPHLIIGSPMQDDRPINENDINKWKNISLSRIRVCFADAEAGKRIRLSGQWLLDSYATKNQLLSFVQAVVCLEILLGEPDPQDEIGLSALLRNRCAYLVGKSQKHREEILKDFSEIYKVRSKIVHTGKSNLSRAERFMLYRLQYLCSQALREEIKLLTANIVYDYVSQA